MRNKMFNRAGARQTLQEISFIYSSSHKKKIKVFVCDRTITFRKKCYRHFLVSIIRRIHQHKENGQKRELVPKSLNIQF